MDLDYINHLLELRIKELNDFRERLSEDGEPLSPADKKLCRGVIADTMNDSFREMEYFIRNGSMRDLSNMFDQIHKSVEQFC